MPKYKLPEKRTEEDDSPGVEPTNTLESPDEWERRVTLPVNDAILAALEIGGEATITIRGSVVELHQSQSTTMPGRRSLTISVDEIEAYAGGESVEDAFSDGFMSGRGFNPLRGY